MRRIFTFLVLLGISVVQVNAQTILAFDFGSINNASPATFNSTSNATGVQSSTISRGSGISAYPATGYFSSEGFTTSSSLNSNDYYQFTVTPAAGTQLTISTITFNGGRTSGNGFFNDGGPTRFALRSSATNNYGSNLGNEYVVANGNSGSSTITLSNTFDFTDIVTSTPVTFRIYGYDAENSDGRFAIGGVNGADLTVQGTAVTLSAVADVFPAPNTTTPVSGNLLTNDINPFGNTVTATLVGNAPSVGTLSPIANGTFTYTPPADFVGGAITFSYRLSSSAAPGFNSNTVSVTINYPIQPIAKPNNFSSSDVTASITDNVLTNDVYPNTGTTTAALVSAAPAGLTFNNNGSFTYTPAADFPGGAVSFTYNITSSLAPSSPSNTATVTLTYPVRPTSGADEFLPTPATSGNPISGNVLGNDVNPNGGTLTAVKTSDPETGTVVLQSNGDFTYTPPANFEGGPITFTYVATSSNAPGAPSLPITVTLNYIELTVTPVNFVSFTAAKVSAGTQLTWNVADEIDVLRYEVEKNSGSGFVKIGEVAATKSSSYSFVDAQSSSGTVQYRVRNVDIDGQFKYTNIISFNNGVSSIALRAFPLPVRGTVTIQHSTVSNGRISIASADGRIVKTVVPEKGSVQTELNLGGLKAGMYLLRFDAGDGKIETIKLIKQ